MGFVLMQIGYAEARREQWSIHTRMLLGTLASLPGPTSTLRLATHSAYSGKAPLGGIVTSRMFERPAVVFAPCQSVEYDAPVYSPAQRMAPCQATLFVSSDLHTSTQLSSDPTPSCAAARPNSYPGAASKAGSGRKPAKNVRVDSARL